MTAELATKGPETPSEVVVRVRDDGIGIAPETLPRVFDLFMQADRSHDRSGGGLGIGLTLVRRLVELHGGSVEAHSAGLGQGSEFVVRLPVLARANQPERPGSRGITVAGLALSPVDAPPRRILVVDDNVDTAESLAILLRLRGTKSRSLTMARRRWRQPARSSPRSFCSTSACPGWTATRSPASCASGAGPQSAARGLDRLWPGRGPAPSARSWIRPPPDQAGRPYGHLRFDRPAPRT